MTYYNDNDKFVCQWTRNLMADGLISKGTVDERSIEELKPIDLAGYERCHFFSGIAGWEAALNLAGWYGETWSGSCPCQPLSCAGLRKGHADKRHLWPAFYSLIAKCRPATIFGEQVASKDGREWFAGVRIDLEGIGYDIGAADLCAAGVGAPQKRQRIYWVANARSSQRNWSMPNSNTTGRTGPSNGCETQRLAGFDQRGWNARRPKANAPTSNALLGLPSETTERVGFLNGAGRNERQQTSETLGHRNTVVATTRSLRLEHSNNQRREGRNESRNGSGQRIIGKAGLGFWQNFDIIPVGNEVKRIEPGSFPLAHGIPARVGRLRAYGNAVCVPLATQFVKAVMESL